MNTTLVSFIIPHKGREQYLQQTLESIAKQDSNRISIEVIVISQNATLSDETLDFKNKLSLSIYNRPASDTISSLRNYGTQKAKGEYLAFLDADIYISENWTACMLDTLNENESRIITSAVQINGPSPQPLEIIRTALSNASINCNVNFLPGRNLFLSRNSFDEIGGFPTHLVTCEDYYFTDKANQLGDLYYTSKASYIHLGEDKDYREMYKKEIWRGQSNLLSIKGRPIRPNETPSFIIPPAILFLFVTSLILLFAGEYLYAAISLFAMILPIFLYSIRLYMLVIHTVSFSDVLKFYLFYFPARAIGTVAGIFKTITFKNHD